MNEETPVVSTAPVINIPPIADTLAAPRMSRKSYGWLIGLVIVLIVAALGVGGWFFYRSLIPSPSEVLAKMMETILSVRTFHMDLTLVPVKGEDPISKQLLSAVSSKEILTDTISNVQVTMEGSVEFVDFFTNEIRYSATSSVSAEQNGTRTVLLAGDMMEENSISYWRLSTFAFPQEKKEGMDQMAAKIMFDELLDQWIGGTDDRMAALQTKTKEARQKKIEEAPLTDVHFLELKEAWTNAFVFTVSQDYGSDVVAGEKVYHYAFTFDEEAWNAFLDRCEEIVADTYLGSEDQTWTKPLRSFVLQNTEVWISSSRFLPLRLKTSITDTVKDTQMDVDIFLSAYGDPVEITVPTDAISPMELVTMMMTKVEDFIKEDPDADGLTNQEESEYQTDINNPDSDGDGYLDGQEVDGGYNPIGEGKLKK